MLNRARTVPAALAAMLAPLVGTTAGCGWGCQARLHVSSVTVRGHGKPRVDVDLSARITNADEPVEGVDIEFFGIGPDGVIIGIAESGRDGIAHLHASGAAGPESINGVHAAQWTAYRARVSVIQGSDKAAATICAKEADAPFRYVP